jgi:uncharacterized protein YuzE
LGLDFFHGIAVAFRLTNDQTLIVSGIKMKVKYFPDTDTAHVEFKDSDIHETKEISENIFIDIDAKGNLVSMTIEHAKANADLWEFFFKKCRSKLRDLLVTG